MFPFLDDLNTRLSAIRQQWIDACKQEFSRQFIKQLSQDPSNKTYLNNFLALEPGKIYTIHAELDDVEYSAEQFSQHVVENVLKCRPLPQAKLLQLSKTQTLPLYDISSITAKKLQPLFQMVNLTRLLGVFQKELINELEGLNKSFICHILHFMRNPTQTPSERSQKIAYDVNANFEERSQDNSTLMIILADALEYYSTMPQSAYSTSTNDLIACLHLFSHFSLTASQQCESNGYQTLYKMSAERSKEDLIQSDPEHNQRSAVAISLAEIKHILTDMQKDKTFKKILGKHLQLGNLEGFIEFGYTATLGDNLFTRFHLRLIKIIKELYKARTGNDEQVAILQQEIPRVLADINSITKSKSTKVQNSAGMFACNGERPGSNSYAGFKYDQRHKNLIQWLHRIFRMGMDHHKTSPCYAMVEYLKKAVLLQLLEFKNEGQEINSELFGKLFYRHCVLSLAEHLSDSHVTECVIDIGHFIQVKKQNLVDFGGVLSELIKSLDQNITEEAIVAELPSLSRAPDRRDADLHTAINLVKDRDAEIRDKASANPTHPNHSVK